MVKSLKRLGKLKGRSLDEFRVRGAQALSAYAERYGLSEQARVPADAAFYRMLDLRRLQGEAASAESLLAHFRSRTEPHFFAAFNDTEATVRELRQRFGGRAEAALIERAHRLAQGRFDLLGLSDLHFGDPPDWHLDPTSGKRTPLVHWSRIDYLDQEVAGDKKIIWELNRQQYLMTLGRAYWYTRDEGLAKTFIEHVSDWMDQNPPKQGINWASSLEIAFRSISWLWALYFFKDSAHLTPAFFLRVMKFLYLSAKHLETYLSTYFSPNTHLTGEALGLYYIGTLWPEFRHAARWRMKGRRILLSELDRHVRPDGVYFEQSSYYHRYTTDFYTHLYILQKVNGETVEPLLEKKLKALLDHLMYITRPDGTTPYFGDDDGGRLVMLDEREANDFRAALATGAALFNRSDYKYVAEEAAEESLWLLGPEGLEAFDRVEARPPLRESQAFPQGGYYVMRDGWSREANYLLIDCGPHGQANSGHAHADALSFEVAAGGRTLLVDPGTYTYTGDAGLRDYFRSSAAHNTLTVDRESSSLSDGPFTWREIARAETHSWISRKRFDYFEGEHDGYARLVSPVRHSRAVLFLKGDYWILRDRVRSDGAHRYDLHFHFAAGADPTVRVVDGAAPVVRECASDAPGLLIAVPGGCGKWGREQGWVSRCYGERTAAPVCVYSVETKGTHEFITFLVPSSAEQPSIHARQIEATGGRCFEMRAEGGLDLLLTNEGSTVETARLSSDFEMAWTRFTPEADVLKELVLIGGQRLCLDGHEIFKSESRTAYAAISFLGEELIVETDAKGEWLIRPPRFVRSLTVNGEHLKVGGDAILRFQDRHLQENKTLVSAEALC